MDKDLRKQTRGEKDGVGNKSQEIQAVGGKVKKRAGVGVVKDGDGRNRGCKRETSREGEIFELQSKIMNHE